MLLAATLAGCSFTPPTPIAYVTHGPAYGQPVTPLAALPVRCGGQSLGCAPGYLLAVSSATRMALEFGGYSLVDSDLINAELRRRVTRTSERSDDRAGVIVPPSAPAVEQAQTETVEITGLTWLDLEPVQRRALLGELGILGTLSAAVELGVPHGMAGQRTVTVRLEVARLADDALVWQSACGVETGDFHSELQAVDLATSCALESWSLW